MDAVQNANGFPRDSRSVMSGTLDRLLQGVRLKGSRMNMKSIFVFHETHDNSHLFSRFHT